MKMKKTNTQGVMIMIKFKENWKQRKKEYEKKEAWQQRKKKQLN